MFRCCIKGSDELLAKEKGGGALFVSHQQRIDDKKRDLDKIYVFTCLLHSVAGPVN